MVFVTLPSTTTFVPEIVVVIDLEVLPDGTFVVLWFNQDEIDEVEARFFWAHINTDGSFLTPPTNIPAVFEGVDTPTERSLTTTSLSIIPLTDPDGSFLLTRQVTETRSDPTGPESLTSSNTITNEIIDVDLVPVVIELTPEDDQYSGAIDEIIFGLVGNDTLDAGLGDDVIHDLEAGLDGLFFYGDAITSIGQLTSVDGDGDLAVDNTLIEYSAAGLNSTITILNADPTAVNSPGLILF